MRREFLAVVQRQGVPRWRGYGLEGADSRPLEEGLTIPEEIKLREAEKAALEEAKREMEKRYEEVKKDIILPEYSLLL
jgi:hypothetical protein